MVDDVNADAADAMRKIWRINMLVGFIIADL